MIIARNIEGFVDKNYPEVRLVSTSSGSDDQGGISSIFGTSGSHFIQLKLKLVDLDERSRSCWDIGDDFRKYLSSIPEIVNFTVTHSNGFGMTGGGSNVAVEIYGYDFDETSKVAQDIAAGISEIPGARDVQISRDDEKPELKVIFDREKLAQHGLNTAMASLAVRNRMDGLVATKFREDGDEYDVIVRFDEQYRNSISDIENIILMNSQGQQVRLKEVGQVVEHWSPPNIEHKRRERIVTVTATPYKIALGDLANAIKDVVANVDKPTNVLIDIGGSYEDMQETNADLGLLFVIIVILVYLIMASQFESFKMPFIIMMSIPFAFSGVILALLFTGTTFSVVAILGAILLVGIVIKNGIVLVDYINLMIDRGYPLHEAIIESGKSRLRPVLMTAFTTVFGLLPMALSLGEGSEVWSPMGIAVIGGLVFSTIITLVLIPVLYAAMAREGARVKSRKKYVEQFKFMEKES
jgi:HAE1 family hydrophobic/amphiphilic exporter-1